MITGVGGNVLTGLFTYMIMISMYCTFGFQTPLNLTFLYSGKVLYDRVDTESSFPQFCNSISVFRR